MRGHLRSDILAGVGKPVVASFLLVFRDKQFNEVLQDYYANFVIVADETRKNQFKKRLDQTGLAPIRDRVDFLNFEEVSTLHSATNDANPVVQRIT
jgi:hypothetical protein